MFLGHPFQNTKVCINNSKLATDKRGFIEGPIMHEIFIMPSWGFAIFIQPVFKMIAIAKILFLDLLLNTIEFNRKYCSYKNIINFKYFKLKIDFK